MALRAGETSPPSRYLHGPRIDKALAENHYFGSSGQGRFRKDAATSPPMRPVHHDKGQSLDAIGI